MINTTKIIPFIIISAIVHLILIFFIVEMEMNPTFNSAPIDVAFYSAAQTKTDIHTTQPQAVTAPPPAPEQVKPQAAAEQKKLEPNNQEVKSQAKKEQSPKSQAAKAAEPKSDIKVKEKAAAAPKEAAKPKEVKKEAAPTPAKTSTPQNASAKPQASSVKTPAANNLTAAPANAQTIQAPSTQVKDGAVGAQYDSVAFDDKSFEYSYYNRIIINKISRFWEWAGDFKSLTVIVFFKINKDGSVDANSLKISKSSGNKKFDENAQSAIVRASPFGPLPSAFKGESIGVYFEFKYK
ncbi:MAG: TonB family protein [Elusimicrobiota bacterium]|jgi:protein TonB|nr:TonB family protein [Elusimicrobiota bacterium]